MGYRDKVKSNIPKVALHSIDSLIAGSYKTGKTRLWKEVTELHYANPDEVLLLAFESGYETWELDSFIPIHQEGSDEELWKVWEYFKKVVVPDLVKEAKEKRIVKLLGIDTADRCVDAATAWLLKDRAKKYGVAEIVSLQELGDVSLNKENGYTALYEEMKKPFDALKNAGYGKVSLAWTKEKETTLYNGMKYNSIELMMHQTARKIFESQASLICCLFNEVTVVDKSGKEMEDNIKDKKGREKGTNFHETRTVMAFRPTEYISIAGGRFTELPSDPVEYSAENFLQVYEEAVKGQLKKTTKTVEELKVEQEQELDEKLQTVEEENKEPEIPTKTVKEYHAEIKAITTPLLKVVDSKAAIMAKFKEIFNADKADYTIITDTTMLEKALQYVRENFPNT